MPEGELNCGNQETELVAGIVTRSFEAHTVKWPLLEKRTHSISNLNLSDGAGQGFFKLVEDIRCQHIPSDNCQIRGRFRKLRLFDHVVDLIDPVFHFLTIDYAKPRNRLTRDSHRAEHGSVVFFVDVEKLLECRRFGVDDI